MSLEISEEIKVSVIVPVYGVEPYLRQCLDSLVGQTLQDIEIILINDASPDNCGHICEEYARKDRRIQVIHNELNLGQGPSRNLGMEKACGEYIGFVDADDWVDLDYYEKLYKTAKKKDYDIAKTRRVTFFSSTHKILRRLLNTQIKLCLQRKIPLFLLFTYEFTTALYRAEHLRSNHAFFADLKSGEDCYFLLRATSNASIKLVTRPHYYYRQHSLSATNNRNYLFYLHQMKLYFLRIQHLNKENLKNKHYCYGFEKFTNDILSRYNKLCAEKVSSKNDLKFLLKIHRALSYHKYLNKNKLEHILQELTNEKTFRPFRILKKIIKKSLKPLQKKFIELRDTDYEETTPGIKISIVVPVFNSEKYLPHCLDSLVKQSLRAIEIILVNDASTDSSKSICDKYAQSDNRIILINNKQNIGQGASRQIGIEAAQGEYIGFVDSDDWVSLDFFETLYGVAKKSNADIAKAQTVKVYSNDHKIEQHRLNAHIEQGLKKSIPLSLLFTYEHWSAIYSREKIIQSGVKYSTIRNGQDTIYQFSLCPFMENIALTNHTKYYYRQHRESVTQNRHYAYFKNILFVYSFVIDTLNKSIKNKSHYFFGFNKFSNAVLNRVNEINNQSDYIILRKNFLQKIHRLMGKTRYLDVEKIQHIHQILCGQKIKYIYKLKKKFVGGCKYWVKKITNYK